jgi:uncharacterized membrane protein
MELLLALLLGVLAGLRTMSALAAVSWAARLGWLELHGSRLAFLGNAFTPWVLTVAAVLELVTDQLPTTPSRKTPVQFVARVASGALCGAAVGSSVGQTLIGLGLGIVGAVIGTLGGFEVRRRLATLFHRDRPAAFLEDAVAIAGVLVALVALR